MSEGNRYYPQAGGLEYSDRTPDGSDRTPATQYTGAYTQCTQGYMGRGGTLEDSNPTPSYSHGGYTQGGRTESGGTFDNSNHTPYSQGGYTQGGYTECGGTLDYSNHTPYSQGGYSHGSYTLGNSDRTPYSGRSSVPSFTTATYTGNFERGGRGESHMSSSQHINSAQYDGSAQYDNLSSSASTSGTTVANGGQGRCPYQIAFQVQNTGKQVSSSKRIINFRFGFANATAISQGRTGTGCRGEEHDIVVTWSITGGKRTISMNDREIQYSTGRAANESRRADVLEASWRMSDHVYNMKCFAYKPAAGSPEKRNPR
jgi:hypothetical protein